MTKLLPRISLVLIAGFGTATAASALQPGFDCDKARAPDEIVICQVPRLAELDNIIGTGYAYLKTNFGRAYADEVGIPQWRRRQACKSDAVCIGTRQIEAIDAYRAAGAPIALPEWATAGEVGDQGAAADGPTSVSVDKEGGTFLVPVSINEQLTLKFIVDSGAADVSIPADVFLTLFRTGTIADSDFLGSQTYTLADGSTAPSQRFVIRSLKVGDKVLRNVTGSIAPVQGSLLLGQSFLSRFRSWSFDNQRQALILN